MKIGEKHYCLLLWGGYTILLFLGLDRHELWLDEAHHWLVAKDSASLGELVSNLRYEGHPILWNILLYSAKYIYNDPLIMQILHGGIISIAVYIILLKSPFPFWAKALMPFGYFFFFEYCLISRNYALAVLFSVVFVSLYCQKHINYLTLGIILAILANTHLLGLGMAICFSTFILLDHLGKATSVKKELIWGGSIFFFGVILSILQILPPINHPLIVTDLTVEKMATPNAMFRVLSIAWESFFPVFDPSNYHFWNTNWVKEKSPVLAVLCSLLIFLMPWWFFSRNRKLLLLFYGMSMIILFLSAFKNVNYARFHGFLFLSFILTIWLAYKEQRTDLLEFPKEKIRCLIVIGCLIVQFIAGIDAFSRDWRYPFSESQRASKFLSEKNNISAPIIAGYCFGESLSAEQNNAITYPEQPRESYCRWQIFDAKYLDNLEQTDFYTRIMDYLVNQVEEVLMVNFKPMGLDSLPIEKIYKNKTYQLGIAPVATFDQSIHPLENYYIYRLNLSRK